MAHPTGFLTCDLTPSEGPQAGACRHLLERSSYFRMLEFVTPGGLAMSHHAFPRFLLRKGHARRGDGAGPEQSQQEGWAPQPALASLRCLRPGRFFAGYCPFPRGSPVPWIARACDEERPLSRGETGSRGIRCHGRGRRTPGRSHRDGRGGLAASRGNPFGWSGSLKTACPCTASLNRDRAMLRVALKLGFVPSQAGQEGLPV